jgi:hypothetical protein
MDEGELRPEFSSAYPQKSSGGIFCSCKIILKETQKDCAGFFCAFQG